MSGNDTIECPEQHDNSRPPDEGGAQQENGLDAAVWSATMGAARRFDT